jgi:hypothetical protein
MNQYRWAGLHIPPPPPDRARYIRDIICPACQLRPRMPRKNETLDGYCAECRKEKNTKYYQTNR